MTAPRSPIRVPVIDPDLYAQALTDVRAIRDVGTYATQAGTPPKFPPTASPQCGTETGYRHHGRRNERACEKCRAAHTERDRRTRLAGK
ncbi:hypothetical protein PV318_03190 [Streptomyces sp. ME02-6991-2B]|nr:hypothetical protein [Streptomyces sp. ME02-6991-2B]